MKNVVRVVLFVLLVVVLAGCSQAAAPKPSESESPPAKYADGASPGAMPIPGPSGATSAPAAQPAPSGATTTAWDRYVIRNGDVSLVVEDVESATDEVKRIAAAAGGFVAQSNVRRDGSRIFADLSIQVPAESFDQVIGELRSLALTVESVRTTSQDVTEEYVDNEAQLRNLRAAEESTLRLLDKTEKMEDVLTVQRELTRIRGDIEKIEGRQNYLKRRVDMSTITVHLAPESVVAMQAARSGWQPFRNAAAAWEASLNFLSVVFDVVVAAVIFLWWAVPLGFLVWALWRRRQRGRARPAQPPVAPFGSQG